MRSTATHDSWQDSDKVYYCVSTTTYDSWQCILLRVHYDTWLTWAPGRPIGPCSPGRPASPRCPGDPWEVRMTMRKPQNKNNQYEFQFMFYLFSLEYLKVELNLTFINMFINISWWIGRPSWSTMENYFLNKVNISLAFYTLFIYTYIYKFSFIEFQEILNN